MSRLVSRCGRTTEILFAVGFLVAGCEDSGEPSTDGTLIVSTSTVGGDPDQDGFQLTVDGADTTALELTGVTEVSLAAGRHTLQLVGVAEHCSVASGTSREVDVLPQGTTPVAFDVDCPAVSARISTTTTGLDIDPNGYRIAVDGLDRGAIPANGTLSTPLGPGSRTIALAGNIPSCTADGQGTRTVNVVGREVPSIDFTVVCTATSGVIGVAVEASGADANGSYDAEVDGAKQFPVEPNGREYFPDVSAGDHIVTLGAPANCSVANNPQLVSVTAGGLVRDTVEITFSVTCTQAHWNVQITAPTSGFVPRWTRYRVMYDTFGYWDYGGTVTVLGFLDPNGTLVARVDTGEDWANYWHVFWLEDVPSSCSVSDPHPYPDPGFTIPEGDVLDVEFEVACPP